MNENTLVLRGRMGTDIVTKTFDGGRMVARFRLAATQWRRRDDGTFEDLKPRWYTVKVWERLAENVLHSVVKGQPLIVVGRPVAEAYTGKDGELVGELVVSAISVGHDLAYGRASFERTRRVEASAPAPQAPRGEQAPAAQDAAAPQTAANRASADPADVVEAVVDPPHAREPEPLVG